jgi:endoglucanase
MKFSRRALVLSAGICALGAAPKAARPRMRGVNLSGLELNPERLPGKADTDFVAPGLDSVAYYADRGASLVRLPFLWERAEPMLGGAFAADYIAVIDKFVDYCATRGMRIILCPHQFGRRRAGADIAIIGEGSAVSAGAFASFWGRFAARYRNRDHVVFGLQNEPHDQKMDILVTALNGAIKSIRTAGAKQLVLAPGNSWTGAHSWVSSGNAAAMTQIRDPAANMAYDLHQYLDGDSSGTHNTCTSGAGDARLRAFTAWARSHGAKAVLGEFGSARDETCLRELDNLLTFMDANRDVWIGWAYWAGGPWWGDDYPMTIEPRAGVDRPQMRILQRHF